MKVTVELSTVHDDKGDLAMCTVRFEYSAETSAAVRFTNPSHWMLVDVGEDKPYSLQDDQGHHFINVEKDPAWLTVAHKSGVWSLALTVDLGDAIGASLFKVSTETGKVESASGPHKIGGDSSLRNMDLKSLTELKEALASGDIAVKVLAVPPGMSPEDAIKAAMAKEGDHECTDCGACGKDTGKAKEDVDKGADHEHDLNMN